MLNKEIQQNLQALVNALFEPKRPTLKWQLKTRSFDLCLLHHLKSINILNTHIIAGTGILNASSALIPALPVFVFGSIISMTWIVNYGLDVWEHQKRNPLLSTGKPLKGILIISLKMGVADYFQEFPTCPYQLRWLNENPVNHFLLGFLLLAKCQAWSSSHWIIHA